VLEACKVETPHLIVLGSPEGADGMQGGGALGTEKRASVPPGAESNFTKKEVRTFVFVYIVRGQRRHTFLRL
jgi:hypothetical protein